MNVEMPSAGEIQHLRTALLIVLGIMIVTIPIVAMLVIVKVKAQQRQGPPKTKSPEAGDASPPTSASAARKEVPPASPDP